jgi:DNA-binding transcriptional MerR regulator
VRLARVTPTSHRACKTLQPVKPTKRKKAGKMDLRSNELANRLGVSDSAIRDWSGRYREFLSRTGQGIEPGATRLFTYEDQTVLATVAHLRAQGMPHDSIADKLANNWRVDPPDETPEPEPAPQPDRALVPVGQLNRALDQIASLSDELESLKAEIAAERNKREADRKDYTARIIELEREAGRLEGELLALKAQRKGRLFK